MYPTLGSLHVSAVAPRQVHTIDELLTYAYQLRVLCLSRQTSHTKRETPMLAAIDRATLQSSRALPDLSAAKDALEKP